MNALIADADALAAAAVEGRLSSRADPGRHQGGFRQIMEGVNATLGAVTGPLQTAAGCAEEIARGTLPAPITAPWAGDFARVRESLKGCIGAVDRMIRDADTLAQAAAQGQLGIRADASAHRGDFGRIIENVNRTLDAVVAPVNEATAGLERLAARDLRARVTAELPGDHARLKEAVNATAEALHEALAQVARAVEQVSGAAIQIAPEQAHQPASSSFPHRSPPVRSRGRWLTPGSYPATAVLRRPFGQDRPPLFVCTPSTDRLRSCARAHAGLRPSSRARMNG